MFLRKGYVLNDVNVTLTLIVFIKNESVSANHIFSHLKEQFARGPPTLRVFDNLGMRLSNQ